jgi:rhodanese-related sulfurtransferase
MQEIIADFEQDGRVDSGYCVVDVRRPDEVAYTGKLCPSVPTLPVELIMQANVFELDEEEFEEVCGFSKPSMDETLVFSCAAGIRSVYACQYAAKAGYTNLISYAGGANEWFRS